MKAPDLVRQTAQLAPFAGGMIALMGCHVAFAQTNSVTELSSVESPQQTGPTPSPTLLPPPVLLEGARLSVKRTVEWLASGIDSKFGDKPFSDGGKVTQGRLGINYLRRENQSDSLNVHFNARLWLPNLSNVPYLYIGSDNARDEITDQPERKTLKDQIRQRSTGDNSFFAGVGLWLADSMEVRIGFRGIKPYAQARLKDTWRLSESDAIEARQTFFYTIKDRAGSTSALEYQHAFRPTTVARWLTSATITQAQRNFAYSSTLGAYESFGNEKVLGTEIQYTNSVVDSEPVEEIGLVVRWEQPIYRNVMGEVSAAHFWPQASKAFESKGEWAAGLGMTLKF